MSKAGALRFYDSEGRVELAVFVRPRWKNHEFQTAEKSESDNQLNVCPVGEDELDDKEEPSEESRVVRGGQTRTMTPALGERQDHERTHIPFRS